jgi:MFS family permease
MSLERAEGDRTYFGWRVAWAAFAVATFSWGIGFYGPSIFLYTLHDGRGWTISIVSAAITSHFLLSAALVTHLPEAHRRFGVARVTQAGVALSVLGLLAWSNAQEPWQLFAAALPSSAGWAATSGAALNAMVAPWFDQARPKAISLAFNGASVGGLVFTPLWSALIKQFGFPAAAMIIGAAMIVILWPVSVCYLQPRPSEPVSPASEAFGRTPVISRTALLCDWRFATMSGAFALGLFAQTGLLAHLVTRLAPSFGPSGASWAVSLAAACAAVGRTSLGWMVGERDRRVAAALNFVLQACGTALLMAGGGPAALLLGCVLFGLGLGNLTSLPPLIAQKEFAAHDAGRVVALMTAINQAVFAFAPFVLGALLDVQGSYVLPFALAAGMQMIAALLVLAGRSRWR